MGFWSINIQGIGAHHNTNHANDADKLAGKFVRDLIKAGHNVTAATFISGTRTDLTKEQEQPQPQYPAGYPGYPGYPRK